MRELRLVGPGDDGGSLVVESVDGGEQFRLGVDDRLRALCRADLPSLVRAIDAEHPAELRPRDIQVRVRAGEEPALIAEEAGVDLDKIMRFAYPVLQERARISDEARRARPRGNPEQTPQAFGELIDARIADYGIDPEAVGWDSFRRHDGGWTVLASIPFEHDQVLAKFSLSLGTRSVSALNDVAADLLAGNDVSALRPAAPEPVIETRTPAGDAGSDDERPMATVAPIRRQKARTHPLPVDIDDELFDQEAFSEEPGWHEPPLPLDLGQLAEGASSDHADGIAEEPGPASDDLGAVDPGRAAEVSETTVIEPVTDGQDEPADDESDPDRPSPAHRRHRSNDKPRMPSWDDILLGVRRRPE